MKPYQSFDGRIGNSRSDQKLARLNLPADLGGKSVLDLGCNEGFFCLEAKRRGAKEVVGLDANPSVIAGAKQYAADQNLAIEYIVSDMMRLPDRKFDFILLMSALHYIDYPAELLGRIRGALAPDGILVLELGIAPGPGRTVSRALRSIDERYFPTMDLLLDVWLRGYSVRRVGDSVPQAGDPVPRHVLHCTPAKTSVIFIEGLGGIGKSTLARQMGNVVTIATDSLFHPFRGEPNKRTPEQKAYDDDVASTGSIWASWEKLKVNPAMRAYFTTVVANAIRQCRGADLIVVEGFVLAAISRDIQKALGREFRCWFASNGSP